jgi:hypothetical protein
MVKRQLASALRCVAVVTVAAALAMGGLALPAIAQNPLEKIDTAAKWVPADVAFYSSMLRAGEQIEIIRKSRAWAEVMAMPSVKQALAAAKDQIENGDHAAQLQAVLKNPETRKALAFLGDMFANEAIVFGDDGWSDFIELFQRINNVGTVSPMLQAVGEPGHQGRQAVGGLYMSTLADNVNLIRIPNLVIGF